MEGITNEGWFVRHVDDSEIIGNWQKSIGNGYPSRPQEEIPADIRGTPLWQTKEDRKIDHDQTQGDNSNGNPD